jgi:murein DD-endopeptidase MepM/ murein hydrolase activator NlpD
MLDNPSQYEEARKYISIRKKYFLMWLLIFIIAGTFGLRYLLLNGLYIGFTPPPPPPPPLSNELISRFNQLEDTLNKTINDVNEVFSYKEKLEKISPAPKNNNSKNKNQGGIYSPLNKLNLAETDYQVDPSFDQLIATLTKINNTLPTLKKELVNAVYLNSNLPEGIPLVGAYTVSSGFGLRPDPFTAQESFHSGVDLAAEKGTPVLAAANGKVLKIDHDTDHSSFGNYIEILHPNGVITLYGHLSEILINESQVLKKGDLIGLVGNTGRSSGPHLHFEVRVDGKSIDPMLSGISPISIKPNRIALSPVTSEVRLRCAPLLLIVKDDKAPLYIDCIASQGKRAKDILISKQSEILSQTKKDNRIFKNECAHIDAQGRLQKDSPEKCRSDNINAEESTQ